ncbi:TRAP transporter substrate-binding protein [Tepidamorphus sp. 3E244]|uniref:TRAP transporter substrate-binding protein n=1 Tax=Tepidamorphus sp. 3E244 TaxID=3385498 RepID=UPI0038FCCC77
MFRRMFAAAALAATLTGTAMAADVTFNLGHVTATNNPYHMGATMFKEAVEEKTDGAVEIKIFPARQLGDDKQLLEGVRLGTIDAALVSASTFSAYTPLLDALQLPFLVTSYEDWAKVLTSDAMAELLEGVADIGVVPLGLYEGGLRHFANVGEPVTKVSQLQGLKVRVVPAPLHLDIWEAIGVNATPMAFGEIYTSLQTGVLDAVEMNATSIYSEKFYEVANSFTPTSQYFFSAVVVINPARWEQLSDDQKQALRDAVSETTGEQVMATAKLDDEALAKLRELGVKIGEFEEQDELEKLVQPVYDEYIGKDPRIGTFVEKVRKMVGKTGSGN